MKADDLIENFKDDMFDYKVYSERLKKENSELKLKIKELETTKPVNVGLADINLCDFTIWLQDNYSTNDKQGGNKPLPKGYWRKDFTDEHYYITEIIALYNRNKG